MDPNSYQSTYDSLAGQYQPQTDLINSQIADLPRQQQAVTDSLNQAKVNAFKDITNSANAKGVLFSGVPIDQQATYTGTKYLPALAQNQTAFQNTKNTLLGQINSLQSARQRQAQDSVSAYQRAQQDNAYKQAQLELGYARLNSSNSNAAASRALRGQGKAPTQAELQSSLAQHIQTQFNNLKGRDNKVSNETWANALNDYIAGGGKAPDFWTNYGGYVNRNYANKYAGYQPGFGQRYTR